MRTIFPLAFIILTILLLPANIMLHYAAASLIDHHLPVQDHLMTMSAVLIGTPPPPIYTRAEQAHLYDVHILFLIASVLWIFFALACLYARITTDHIRDASRIALIILIALAVFFSTGDFRDRWVDIHEPLFPQGNYTFPESSILIQTYPLMFFGSLVFIVLALASIVLIILAFPPRCLAKKQTFNNHLSQNDLQSKHMLHTETKVIGLAAKKPTTKAAGAAKRPTVRKAPAKKTAVKKPVRKAVVKKPAVKKAAVRKPAVRKAPAKKAAVRKPAVRKAVKKPAVKKPAVRKAVKKPVAKKPAVKKTVRRPAKK